VHITALNYLIIFFRREFALQGVRLLPLAYTLALGAMGHL
jgi:hypothetical protein